MADRKPFLLRLDPALFEALQRWANDEVRSLNGQIEYVLTRALRDAGRLKTGDGTGRSAEREADGKNAERDGREPTGRGRGR
jgi:hypothetical protein